MKSYAVTQKGEIFNCKASDPTHCKYHGTPETTGTKHFPTKKAAIAYMEELAANTNQHKMSLRKMGSTMSNQQLRDSITLGSNLVQSFLNG
jgi:hypothetical protein